jgi:hypothetical protein
MEENTNENIENIPEKSISDDDAKKLIKHIQEEYKF